MKKHHANLLLILACATASIHIINKIEISNSTFQNVLNSTKNKYYEWRFGKIKYIKKGSGEPILLLHDLSEGSCSYEYSKLVNILAKKYEVYAIDFLGYGLSDKPNITYTGYLYVQMISDFIKNIVGKKTSIVASGKTFPIAIMSAYNNTELIKNIVGINPQNLFQLNQIPSKQTKMLKLLLETPIIGTFLYNLQTNKKVFTKKFQEEFFYNPFAVEDKDIISYLEASHVDDCKSKYSHASLIGRYTNSNILHALKEINNNICIIGGEYVQDIQNIIDNYVYYNGAIESVIIEKTKQIPQLENPKEVSDVINIFI